MRINDSLKTAYFGLKHAKARSFLTILGIVIGIASVVILMSIGSSAQKLILNQVKNIGSNIIFILPGATKGSRFSSPSFAQGVVTKTLVKQDTDAISRDPSVKKVAPQAHGQAKIVYENNDTLITYVGTTGDFFSIRNFNVQQGSAFTNLDVDSLNRVAVLGDSIAKTIFGFIEPIGKTIRIKNISFKVIGVLEKKGIALGVDQDILVLIPVTVAQKQILGTNYYSVVNVEANELYDIEFVKARIISILRKNHQITDPDKDDFTIRSQEDALDILGNITSILTVFLASIASISLLVGGIGIMNIMLVSVAERTKEIGLRKAVGATNADILQQFLWEAVMLTFIGGIAGVLFGSASVIALYFILIKFLPTGWVFALPPYAVFLAVIVSTLTGLIFGIYPARKASLKNPIDALRYE